MAVLSKTTLNYAERQGYCLDIDGDVISVYEGDEDSEPMFNIRHFNGEFFFGGNIYLPYSIKEELPHWMPDELRLRRMIKFVATARKA
jgi:hypothetical protein